MKRVITVIVLLAFLAVSVFSAPASAVVTEALLVAGGVMTVGLVASIIICAAAGGGMNSVINEKSAQLGVTPKSFITQKVGEYCQETGMSTPNLLRLFMSGTAISPGNPFDPGSGVATAGNLLLTGSLALWLTGFFSWLWNGESNEDKLEDFGTPVATEWPDTWSNGSVNLIRIKSSQLTYQNYYNPDLYVKVGSNSYYSYFGIMSMYYTNLNIDVNPIYVTSIRNGNQIDVYYMSPNDISAPYSNSNNFMGFRDASYSLNGRWTASIRYSDGYYFRSGVWKHGTGGSITEFHVNSLPTSSSESDILSVTPEDILGSGDSEYKENPFVYDPDQLGKPLDRFVVGIGESVKEDTDDPDFPPDVIVGKIPVGDYIEQVAGYYCGADTNLRVETDEGIVDVPIELTDAGTGVIADAGSIPVVIADEQAVVVADSEQVAEATEDMELDEYTLDLKDFFPFCIPFDIYNMLQLFSDTAEAPNFDWRFYVPGVLDYTLEVDLSDFDPLAEVLRRLELIAFAVALAFATKNIIQGGD